MFRALEAARAGGVKVGRYLVKERIGAGGMGVVYRAVDLDRAEEVALKTLQRLTPSNLLRLKREFRSVADLSHENLVSLRELVSEGPDWFYTMELVQGTNLLAFVREGSKEVPRRDTSAVYGDVVVGPTSEVTLAAPPPVALVDGSATSERPTASPSPLDEVGVRRLRLVLPQLVRAVSALHQAGMLHRDLKPGNVLVDKRGRVVVLDFGLVGELDPNASEGSFCGTPAYAAPEQLHSPAGPASDWYAVGVMMYEALTGRLPFRGDPMEILALKQSMVPISPGALVDAPLDLEALTMALLDPVPSRRPSAADIATALSHEASSHPPASMRSERPAAPTPLLIGRDRELGELYAALGEVRTGTSTLVRVHGGSGIGKTCLLRSFCEELEARGRALVLTGRCYERESVPFKALDPVVDSIARRLSAMTEAARESLREKAFPSSGPASLDDLVLAFPVLSGFAPKRRASTRPPTRETAEQLKQAARGLAVLLRAVAGADPLVLWTDDLQWGDRDSARMIAEILDARAPDGSQLGPTLLWIGSFREGAERESPFLQELADDKRGPGTSVTVVDLPVTPLSDTDATRLVRSRIDAMGARPDTELEQRTRALVAEAAGSPYFIEELVRRLGDESEPNATHSATIDELIESRLALLSPSARSLLEAVAVAGGPLPQEVALAAAGTPADAHAAVVSLRSAQLVRTYGARPGNPIEPWHDRVRETVYSRLDPTARSARHLALAESLASRADAVAHRLATHFFLGGDRARAAKYALLAADEAAHALAFDRAAELFQLATDSLPDEDERASVELERRYADALVATGRCAEAAPLYLAAAKQIEARGGSERKARDLERKAAEQLLVSGRREEGIRVLRPLLDRLGLRWPATPRSAMVSIVASFLKLEITGTRFKPKAESQLDPKVLERADLCWSAGSGLLAVDSVRGGFFMVWALEESLRSGDRFRAARSLAIFGMMQVYSGKPRSVAKGRKIFDQVESISATLDSPVLDGTLACCRGTAEMSIGEWRRGLEGLERGIEILRHRCVGVSWELGSTISSTFNTRLWLGENREIGQRAPTWHREAEAVGDWFSTISAELYMAYALLSCGKTDEARSLSLAAISRWHRDDAMTYQKWLDLKIQVLCDLADDRPNAALARLDGSWKKLEASGLLGVELMLQDAHLLRGTTLLAQAGIRGRRDVVGLVEKSIKTLSGIRRPTATGCAKLLSAQLASLRGDDATAVSQFEEASSSLRSVDVRLLAAVADQRRASLVGGDTGRDLARSAEEHAREERIGDWDRWVRIHAPLPATQRP